MADKKTTASDIQKLIKEKEVKYVDIRFTDPRGKWQHVTFDLMMVDEDFLNNGTMFDGSSIAGWKAINEFDMLLKPDLETAVIDPFFAQTTLILICDVLEPPPTRIMPAARVPSPRPPKTMSIPRASATPPISARKPNSSSSTMSVSTSR